MYDPTEDHARTVWMRLHLNNQYGNVVYKGVFGEHADLF